MQAPTPAEQAAVDAVMFEDPALLGFDLSEDDDEGEEDIGSLLDDAEEDDLLGVLDGIVSMLDDADGLSPLQKAKLSGELLKLKKAMQAGDMTPLQKGKTSARLLAIRKELGAASRMAPAAAEPGAVEAAGQPRKVMGHLYQFDPNRKQSTRKKDNAAAMSLLREIEAGRTAPGSLTEAQKQTLAKYSGTGGALVGADGKKGSAYEYYTPKPIAKGMWSLLKDLGFSGGRVLDPSAGVGIFGATAPANAAVDAVELNATSGRVNQLVNDGPGYKTTIAPFEQVAAATPDETYDAVVTNVPFGGVEDRGGNQFKDTKYRNEPLQNYFIMRSLEKLRPGGLAAFITPPRCVSGKGGKEEDLRVRASFIAEFMGAYRLPNSVFGTAAADTMTDVVVFRKYSREALDKIEEVRAQDPTLLVKANVLWQEFTSGMYFLGEGRRFVLGEFVAKDPNKYRDVDRVINNGSMAEIARLLVKFPDSRVNWDLLNAKETEPIVYRDGDSIHHAGETLELRDGRWVPMAGASDGDEARAAMAESIAKLSSPLGAVNSGMTLEDADRVREAMLGSGRALEIPDWFRGLRTQLERVAPGARPAAWNAAIVGLAIDQAMLERQGEETGFNYLEGYAVLSDAMKLVASDAKNPPSALSNDVKTAMKKVAIHFDKRAGFSATWRGDVAQATDSRDEGQKFEAARYQAGGGAFVALDQAKAVYGEGFDPVSTDEWCLSADGKSVAKADDYYVGSYADFLARINADIEAATDDAIKAKLLRQKLMAEQRLVRQDPASMSFTIFSPFVTLEERAEFVRRFVDPRFSVAYDEADGKPFIQCDIKAPSNEAERNLKRFAEYLKGGSLSTRTSKEDKASNPALERARIEALRNLATTAGAQFNAWAKSNGAIMARLGEIANDPARIYFKQVDDESPLQIPGLKPEWSMHGYQNSWIRRMGREFSGINGFGVGLGKTASALVAVQHAQSIGVKKRTAFIVPNSVLSNWRKEAARVYATTDDCLYVGLTQKGENFKVDSSNYDRDLSRITEGRHAKIFLTMEAFQRLRLKTSTAEAYDAHLARVDASYAASDDKKSDEKGKSRRAALIDALTSDPSKSAAAPYFEDLGIDSLVMDEAHAYKNSRATVEFGPAKFLSLADPSGRGLDAQAKAWFVRKNSARNDGVILLTATAITNSPLEVYSMLSLAVGDDKVNGLMMGCRGADDFMEVMCRLENRDEQTLDGIDKPYDVFVGLQNVGILRAAIDATCTVKSAEDVGAQIVMPDAEEMPTRVDLSPEVKATLVEYKEAFRFAIDTVMERPNPRGSPEAFERVSAKFGEPMELIGHPFNLINKMTALIADPELDERASFYIISPAQADAVQSLVGAWNAKAPTEERPRVGPHTGPDAVVGTKRKKDGDDFIDLLKIQTRAKVDGNRIILDSIAPEVQAKFEAMAEKEGVDLDVTVPPKLAALIANFQKEEANPRGKVEGLPSGRVRQLIFCDVLSMHQKIKRLLVKRCGVPASAIAIITGSINGKPEEILEVQDGFNAEGDGNKYRVCVANEKAETGLNLQKGTQAIHHLTLGWTPDSLTQRNGRGVRQGNQTKRVTVYHYDADGTFDSYKRMLVGKKADWIEGVMSRDGGDTIDIATGLTRQQMEALIDSSGDADAMSRHQAEAETADRIAREVGARDKQRIMLQSIKAQQDFTAKYKTAQDWAADKVAAYVLASSQVVIFQDRLNNPKATASSIVKNQNLLAEFTAKRDGLKRLIEESTLFTQNGEWDPLTRKQRAGSPATLDQFVQASMRRVDRGVKASDHVAEQFRKGRYDFGVTVSEDGEIGNEWRSEVDGAQQMVKQLRQDFQKVAAQGGAYPSAVLDRVDAGEVFVIDGTVICAGAFISNKEGLSVVVKNGNRLISMLVNNDGTVTRSAVADVMRDSTVALPGSAGYDALVSAAAKVEDAIAKAGPLSESQLENLYSSVVPEVAQRRSQEVLVEYSSYSGNMPTLPAPYFPVVVPHDAPESARVCRLIAAQQADVVKSTREEYGYLKFVCSNVVAVDTSGEQSVKPVPAMIEFAKAAGVKVTYDDLVAVTGRLSPPLTEVLSADARDFAEVVIAGSSTEDEIKTKTRAWLASDLLPNYDLDTDPETDADALKFLGRVSYQLAAAANVAIAKLKAAAVQPEAVAAEPLTASDATAEPTDENRMVGVSGDTKRWKDQIKEAARAVGGRPVWDGDALQWNIPYKAFTRLVQTFPAAGKALNVVEFSGKANYGRRRQPDLVKT
jgi:hypothetical protein